MRTILTIVLGIFIIQTLSAQNDTLVIKLDDYGQLLIANSNLITEKTNKPEIDELYSEFYTRFKMLQNGKSFAKEGYVIEFDFNKTHDQKPAKISIKEKNKSPDKYYFNKKQMGAILDHKFSLQLSPKIHLFLDSLKDFEKVAKISLDSLYMQSRKNIEPDSLNRRLPHWLFFNSSSNQLDEQSQFIYTTGKPQDYLNLYTSFGAQMINSNFAPQIDINADVAFNWKGSPGQKFGMSATFLFMPDKDDFHNINTYNFANVSYYLKFNQKWSHKISVGYLFAKNGEHFSYNTWNAFWQANIKDIGVKIGCYFTKNTDGDYVTIPSFGVSIGF